MDRVDCVGALVYDEQHRLLLIRRGHDPGAGLWSIPGGRVEPGETDPEAVAREVHEETGLHVAVGPLVGEIERPGLHGSTYVIRDYAATTLSGTLTPGDDATEARFVTHQELTTLRTTDLLIETLTLWKALPA